MMIEIGEYINLEPDLEHVGRGYVGNTECAFILGIIQHRTMQSFESNRSVEIEAFLQNRIRRCFVLTGRMHATLTGFEKTEKYDD